jgi:hypothetical protein
MSCCKSIVDFIKKSAKVNESAKDGISYRHQLGVFCFGAKDVDIEARAKELCLALSVLFPKFSSFKDPNGCRGYIPSGALPPVSFFSYYLAKYVREMFLRENDKKTEYHNHEVQRRDATILKGDHSHKVRNMSRVLSLLYILVSQPHVSNRGTEGSHWDLHRDE